MNATNPPARDEAAAAAPLRLLVTGERRSGTTLMANFLNAQPGVVICRDLLHFLRFADAAGVTDFAANLSAEQKRTILDAFEHNQDMLELEGEERVAIDPASFDTLAGFYTRTLDSVAGDGVAVVGHKSTMAHRGVERLLDAVDNVKVLYVLRDPRDVVASGMRKWPWFHAKGVYEFIDGWADSYATIARLTEREAMSQRLLIVTFEELILESDRTFERLAAFLGVERIEMPSTMSDYGNRWSNNSSFGDLSGGFDARPIGRWRQASPDLIERTEVTLEPLMRQAGYEPSRPLTPDDRTREERRRERYLKRRVLPYRIHRFAERVRSGVRRRLPGGLKRR